MRWKWAALCILFLLIQPVLPGAESARNEKAAAKTTPVREVQFKGNSAFAEKRLRSVLGLQNGTFSLFARPLDLGRIEIRRMAQDLTLFYQRQGYFDAEVKPIITANGSVTITITEGEPSRVKEVRIIVVPRDEKSGRFPGKLAPVAGIAAGDIFTVDKYEAGGIALTRKLKNSGYPFAETEPKAEINTKSHETVISYKVNTGEKGKFGKIVFEGIIHTEEKILRRALTFKPGEIYRQSLVDDSRETLYKMGLFESVVIQPQKAKGQGIVPMSVNVKEGRHRTVQASIGYSTDEGPRGMAGWETLRIDNKILTLGVESRLSDIQMQTRTYIKRPYVFNHHSSFLSDLSYSRLIETKFTYRSLKARAGFDFLLSHRLTFSSYGTVEKVLQVSSDRDLKKAIEEGARDVATIASGAFSFTWNSTDKPITPGSGSIISFFLEPSHVIETKVDFEKVTAEGRHYLGLGHDTVLAFRLGAGGIFSGSPADEIPLTKRFYAGGSSSVRGYRYNVLGPLTKNGVLLGGNGLVEASMELRFPVRESLTGVGFVDAGNATPHPFSLKDAKVMAGAGAGIRYTSPVGPIGLDIAWKLVPYPLDRSPYMIHFFIGYAF